MAHGNAIINCDGVKFDSEAAVGVDDRLYPLPNIEEVNMPRHKLGKGVCNGDNGFVHIAIRHASGPPQGPCPRHMTAFKRGCASELTHSLDVLMSNGSA